MPPAPALACTLSWATMTASEEEPLGVQASCWRLSNNGLIISSVVERHVDWYAESEKDGLYFYAELGSPTELKNSEETMQKVYSALAGVGLSEGQIIDALSAMQNSGILFRERAI